MDDEIRMIPFSVPSSDGIHTLRGRVCVPPGPPRGVFQVVHGMTEHIARYEPFFREMAADGFLCCGHDHLGHGRTARDESELGYFADRNGCDLLQRDVRAFGDAVREAYGPSLPYLLMGHSMGSFIARLAAERYVRPDGLVVMGTGRDNPAAPLGLLLISLIGCFRGRRYRSSLVRRMTFAGFNSRFGGGSPDDPAPWLTTDRSVRGRYYADPFCTFTFTLSAMADLLRLTRQANRRAWFRSLPEGMPILLVSGAEDPVGGYGKGVLHVRDRLEKAGAPVSCVLYEGARHEILNDVSRARATADIQAFAEAVVRGKA